jgi:hypothetical protein
MMCGFCLGRGVNSNGSDCEFCDCGFVDVDRDIVAEREAGARLRPENMCLVNLDWSEFDSLMAARKEGQ